MRTTDQLITALRSVNPSAFGPEHISLCRDAANFIERHVGAADSATAIIREAAAAHLVLAELPQEQVEAALKTVRERFPDMGASLQLHYTREVWAQRQKEKV